LRLHGTALLQSRLLLPSRDAGQGESYTFYDNNTWNGATGGNYLFGSGNSYHLVFSNNTVDSPDRGNYLFFIGGSAYDMHVTGNTFTGSHGIKIYADGKTYYPDQIVFRDNVVAAPSKACSWNRVYGCALELPAAELMGTVTLIDNRINPQRE